MEIQITITKAEGTERGNGWYYLLNGVKDGIKMIDEGGEDWFSSEKAARQAAKNLRDTGYWTREYGWVCNY